MSSRVVKRRCPSALLLLVAIAAPLAAATLSPSDQEAVTARRMAWRTFLLSLVSPTRSKFIGRLNAVDQTWEEWVERTGEMPDFATMPAHALLPDPMIPLGEPGAQRIRTAEEWNEQRRRIRAQFEHWIYGTMPPPPDNLRGRVVAERLEGDARVQDVVLEFGPDLKGMLRLQLMIPPGDGPFPVFLTNHPRRRPWVNTAVRRGYLACIVYAVDPYYSNLGKDVGDDSDAWIELYPDDDWSAIARWAWGAMRAVDYLVTRPDVIADQIGITGHSRNSKSALLAAAFDDRIGAVVPSRGNTGDQIPWRFTSDTYVSEPIEEVTNGLPHWFHPRLRFFIGNEHKLPVDQNLLISLVAPRGFMFSHAFTEHQGNVLGIEECYRSVREVWKFLGHPEHLGLYQKPGEHESSPEDVEVYIDFFDTVFGRSSLPAPEMWVRNYSFERWLQQSAEAIDPLVYRSRRTGDFLETAAGQPIATPEAWETRRSSILERIRWTLGERPGGLRLPGRSGRERFMAYEGYLGDLLPRWNTEDLRGRSFPFGDNLTGQIYSSDSFNPTRSVREPETVETVEKYPVVIWLHPYSYATGNSRWASFKRYTERGLAVVTFDQVGFGSRSEGVLHFYDRFPHWSLLGRMVEDVRNAIDMLTTMPRIDPDRIYVAGYGLGGKVGLVTAALDPRVAGVVSISGFAPMRLDTPEKGTEGIRHYSHLHGLTPRLGFFLGHEDRLPVDWDEIVAAIAPRPVWIGAPSLDRFNPIEDVRRAVLEARGAYALYGAQEGLVLREVQDFRALPNRLLRESARWLQGLAEASAASGAASAANE